MISDRTIQRRFRRYGRYAGLAFWLFCTQDWVPELPSIVRPAAEPAAIAADAGPA
jgi:hypothetical protein